MDDIEALVFEACRASKFYEWKKSFEKVVHMHHVRLED